MTEPINNDTWVPLRRFHNTPFAWVAMTSMRFISGRYSGEKSSTARSIYLALAECASEHGRRIRKHSAIFYSSHSYIASKSGKSVSTIKRYLNDFREFGLIAWKVQKQGKTNKVNKYALLRVPAKNDEPRVVHNNELNTLAHNSELDIKEGQQYHLYNKDKSYDLRRDKGAEHIGDILKGRRGI